jgi:predicted transcriptional regulator
LVELTSEKQLESGREISVSAKTIAERTSLDPQEINDAVEELDEYGLAERRRQLGTKPYSFAFVNPTYVLPLKLGQAEVGYDPEAHVKALATLVRERQRVGGPEAAEALHLKPLEVNRAASYLIDNDIVDAFMTMGTAPFSFRALRATRKTREFVDKECV